MFGGATIGSIFLRLSESRRFERFDEIFLRNFLTIKKKTLLFLEYDFLQDLFQVEF
jgi:hypothetical protein